MTTYRRPAPETIEVTIRRHVCGTRAGRRRRSTIQDDADVAVRDVGTDDGHRPAMGEEQVMRDGERLSQIGVARGEIAEVVTEE